MVERGGGRGQGGLGTGVSHTVQRPQGQCLVWEVGRTSWEEKSWATQVSKLQNGLLDFVQANGVGWPCTDPPTGPKGLYSCTGFGFAKTNWVCTDWPNPIWSVQLGLVWLRQPTRPVCTVAPKFGSKFELSYWVCAVGPKHVGWSFLGGSTFGATQLVRPQWKGPGVRGRRPQLGLHRWVDYFVMLPIQVWLGSPN